MFRIARIFFRAIFFPLLVTGAAGAGADARAGIEWEKTTLEFHPGINDTEAKGEFRFVNSGKTPVTIHSITTECGCTTATLEKKIFQPGERGAIAVTFDFGVRKGRYEKHVTVDVAGEKDPAVLTLIAAIPELVRFKPELIYWREGEAAEPKSIDVTALPAAGSMRVTNVASSSEHLKTRLETVSDGKQYRIVVQPKDTKTDVLGVLTVMAVFENGATRNFEAYALVKVTPY